MAIVKLEGKYILWSGVCDAPVSGLLTREELFEHIREERGRRGVEELERTLKRVDERGTSVMHHSSADDTMWLNRAGRDETRLTRAQIIAYCSGADQPRGYPSNEPDECTWTHEMFAGEAPVPR